MENRTSINGMLLIFWWNMMEQKNIYKWDDGNGVEIGKKTSDHNDYSGKMLGIQPDIMVLSLNMGYNNPPRWLFCWWLGTVKLEVTPTIYTYPIRTGISWCFYVCFLEWMQLYTSPIIWVYWYLVCIPQTLQFYLKHNNSPVDFGVFYSQTNQCKQELCDITVEEIYAWQQLMVNIGY